VLAQTRQAALVSSFTSALTTGSRTGGATLPIDLHAHDALRYIGDMLAWVHQAIAAEREFLEALLSIDTGARMRRTSGWASSRTPPSWGSAARCARML
jgi:hypothetical protein